MRCSATHGVYRCQQEMKNHDDDMHTFLIEWGEGDVEPTPAEVAKVVAPAPQDDDLPEGITVNTNAATGEKSIQATPPPAETCMICDHPWHIGPCPLTQRSNGHTIECGCEAAA